MLSKWSVSNFKAITTTRVIDENENESEELIFKPLTIFCGANSSGKSSLLQSILLMAQTMRHQNKEHPLILNGAFTSLGKFDDIKTNPSDENNIIIQFTYKPSKEYKFTYDNYPFCNDEFIGDDGYERIIDTFFSVNFCQNKNEILPMLSHFELLINFYEHTLKYYCNEQDELKKLFYYTQERLDSEFQDNEFQKCELQEIIEMKKLSDVLPGDKCKWNHFLPERIKINGMHIMIMLMLNNICKNMTFYYDGSGSDITSVIIPDKMNKWAENLNLDWKISHWDFYYAERITENVFRYLKDDLLSDIKGIDNLFDKKDFEFSHATRGYPIRGWLDNFKDLPPLVQKEVIERIKGNIDVIYNKSFDELSKIKEVMEKYKTYDSKKQKNIIENPYDDFKKAKGCCDVFFGDFTVSKKLEKYFSEIARFFSSDISYLGPLREDPKSLYPISDLSYTKYIDKKGENTAAIIALDCENNTIRSFPVPDMDGSGTYRTENKSLKESAVEWLRYIGVVIDIKAKIEQGGFTLKVKTSDQNPFSDLTNVGVGVSQVLPIVVMCLSAKEGSTLIIEQPELHLHPKMQTKLTDFFIAMSQSGRQCIIETHSEHFINALRCHVAKANTPNDEKLANDIQIYFSKKDEKGTVFNAIGINKYAAMSDWPEGFFDEASKNADEIIKAVSKKWDEEDN